MALPLVIQLFMRETTLMAQSFDATRLQLEGEPFIVAEGVLTFPDEGDQPAMRLSLLRKTAI